MAGINDIISFHGESVGKFVKAFEDIVDDYLETSEKIGRDPRKCYSSKLMLRVQPEVHPHAAKMAKAHGKSRNAWMAEVLTRVE